MRRAFDSTGPHSHLSSTPDLLPTAKVLLLRDASVRSLVISTFVQNEWVVALFMEQIHKTLINIVSVQSCISSFALSFV